MLTFQRMTAIQRQSRQNVQRTMNVEQSWIGVDVHRQVDFRVPHRCLRRSGSNPAMLPVTTFWSFLREFSPLGGYGGGIGCAGPANLLRPPVYWIEVRRADIFSAPNEWTSTRQLRSHSLKRFKTLVF